jgi:hypothetical protein
LKKHQKVIALFKAETKKVEKIEKVFIFEVLKAAFNLLNF